MQYKLNTMDTYFAYTLNTVCENTPLFECELDESIDKNRLLLSVNEVIKNYPRLKSKLSKINNEIVYESNNEDIIIFDYEKRHNKLNIGKATNYYLFKICCTDNLISFEWCHALCDGKAALEFFSNILECYFNQEVKFSKDINFGYEDLYDEKIKPFIFKEAKKGYSKKHIDFYKDRNYCQSLKMDTKELLALSKRSDGSPISVICPLASMAIRDNMKRKADVKSEIVFDVRNKMNLETTHNCILAFDITYIDKFDSFDFDKLSTVYRTLTDIALQEENIIDNATKTTKLLKFLFKLPNPFNLVNKLIAMVQRTNHNLGLTYLGKLTFSDTTMSHIKDFNFIANCDMGEANISMIDVNGMMKLNFVHRYKDNKVVNSFIDRCKKLNLSIETIDSFEFNQCLTDKDLIHSKR